MPLSLSSRFLSRFLVLALTGTLASCAPTTTAPAVVDPILAKGQVWVMLPSTDKRARTLMVGDRDLKERSGAAYGPLIFEDKDQIIAHGFYYDPVDSDPDFIAATYITTAPSGQQTVETCFIRNPVPTEQGKTLAGVFAPSGELAKSAPYRDYIITGNAQNLPTCLLTRAL